MDDFPKHVFRFEELHLSDMVIDALTPKQVRVGDEVKNYDPALGGELVFGPFDRSGTLMPPEIHIGPGGPTLSIEFVPDQQESPT